ncbi:MAG: 2-oxoacid:acceptor oxidoreductase subunit alpha [Phycisphaeraceae bacterium]|nr:2-oxoacid:acceptor oxidoreductase subunit alpha [Phycisphaeraceae bacterium]
MATETTPNGAAAANARNSAVVRFAGDSGDGMQLAGTQLTDTSAILGNDVATLPDYPAEIRAPAGTVAGVSGFQVNFAAEQIFTPGDVVNALIAMNPAAFKAHYKDVEPGGIIVVNETEFSKTNLKKAGYEPGYNPIEDEAIDQQYKIYKVPITKLNQEALKDTGMSPKDVNRCKNMYALGIVYWLFDRSLDITIRHLNETFAVRKKRPEVAEANIKALKAGYFFGETAEMFPVRYAVAKAPIPTGKYRKVTGNEALAMGLITASKLAGKSLHYCTYPITPASDILHYLAPAKNYGVKTFQAEDEIAAMCAAIGVGFAGQLGVTGTSGPGLALKGEALGLAVMTELPVVVVNVQRGGPSTGLPTKTEQSDLWQAMYGRNGDCPAVVIAPQSPGDCFNAAIEAARIALTRMMPVVLLTDGYIANGSEPWRVPTESDFEPIEITHASYTPTGEKDDPGFAPYTRNENLTRPWGIPGTPGTEHRVGGLEKANGTGSVSYDPTNHQTMTRIRAEKVNRVQNMVPDIEVQGDEDADLLVLGWGGPYGSILTAVNNIREQGKKVATTHLRYLSPMPKNLGDVLKKYDKVLIPELNNGQLRLILRGKFLCDARGLNKIQGKPFLVEEIEQAIELLLSGEWGDAEALYPVDGNVDVNAQALTV